MGRNNTRSARRRRARRREAQPRGETKQDDPEVGCPKCVVCYSEPAAGGWDAACPGCNQLVCAACTLDECNAKDALLYVMTQERRRMKMEMRRMEMKLALAEERVRIGLAHPMVCESWGPNRKLGAAAIDRIPDRADATALVLIGSWDDVESNPIRLEPELQKLVAHMGPEAVWSPVPSIGSGAATIAVPCSVVRRFLQTSNAWWYLPRCRAYEKARLLVVLSVDHDQPMDVEDFGVYIQHRRHPSFFDLDRM